MFVYCNNTPINGVDPSGRFFIELLREWLYGTGQEVAMADGPVPAGDVVFVAGLGALGLLSLLELGYNAISSSGSSASVDGVSSASAAVPKSICGSTPASPPNPNKNNKPTNTTGKGQAPKQGEPGSTYTQISSDGKNQIVSQTKYNEHGLPGERIDFIGRAHGGVETPHVHQFSWIEINGIWYQNGEIIIAYCG